MSITRLSIAEMKLENRLDKDSLERILAGVATLPGIFDIAMEEVCEFYCRFSMGESDFFR